MDSLTAGEEHSRAGGEDAGRVELVVEVLEVRVAGEHPVEDGEGRVHRRRVLQIRGPVKHTTFINCYS